MKYTYILLALCFLTFSCQREEMDNEIMTKVETGEPMVRVDGSVVGFILDENDNPVENAIVTLSNITTMTNEFGGFVFIDQSLYADGTYITVNKPGYFPGSRRFNAVADEQNNVVVRLIEKNEVGSYSTADGGSVDVATAKIDLPSGTYTYENGTSYSGNVTVFAKYLDPTRSETFEEMPGDLTGVDSEGGLNVLATFGMVAVELEDDGGEKVHLPEGGKATIRMAVPSALLSIAPETIPLWHFDEVRGIWLEEGEASLENGVYVGEVGHFSFWNCDYPIPSVEMTGSVILNGRPISGVKVQVTDAVSGFTACTLTGSGGVFAGGIPEGNVLLIRVLDPCGDVMFEQEIGPFTEDYDMPPIEITTSLSTVSLSGNVTNCTGENIVQSAVIIAFGSTQTMVLCEADGSFEYNTPPCQNGSVEVYGLDISNSLISPPAVVDFSGTQNVGTLIACEDFFQEGTFINYLNMDWGMTANDSTLVGYAYEIDTFFNGGVTEIKLTYTVIDWFVYDQVDNLVQYEGEYSYTLGEDTAELIGRFPSQGFQVTGTTSYDEINQTGNNFLRFLYNTTDVEITDPNLYPGDVGQVDINITFQIN